MSASRSRFELVPVGVGAAYQLPGQAQTSYLVRVGGRTVLLDLGAGALNRLQAHVAPEDLDLVVISHLHPDHCVDLLALRVYMAWGPGYGRRLRVRGPAGLRERLAAFGEDGLDRAFTFETLEGDRTGTDLADDVDIRHVTVPHIPGTYATRIDHGGRSVCFGADCAPCEELPALARGVDLLVAECSFGDAPIPEGVPHLNGTEAGRIARAAGAGRMLLTHGLPEHDREAAVAMAAAEAGVPVAWATQDQTEEP